ncbi:MAG: peptidoglycan-binding domain-containing protein [Hyphomicrobiaceae bacterium]
MPLTPFQARTAVAAFLLASMGVAANLLMLQTPGPSSKAGAAASLAMDAERLRRLSMEAAQEENGGKPLVPAVINAPPKRPPVQATRAGRFSPSAGAMIDTSAPDSNPIATRTATISGVQTELTRRGYQPGAIDGAVGLVTRAAILAYENDNGLPLSAEPSPELLAHLRHGTSAPGLAVGFDGEAKAPSREAESVTRAVQQSLHHLGYLSSTADGRISEETARAIREFEMDSGMIPTGRISAPLVNQLAKRLNRRS